MKGGRRKRPRKYLSLQRERYPKSKGRQRVCIAANVSKQRSKQYRPKVEQQPSENARSHNKKKVDREKGWPEGPMVVHCVKYTQRGKGEDSIWTVSCKALTKRRRRRSRNAAVGEAGPDVQPSMGCCVAGFKTQVSSDGDGGGYGG